MQSSSTATHILTAADLLKITEKLGLDQMMDALISRLERAFKDYDPEKTQTPVRAGFDYAGETPGLIEWMPALRSGDSVVVKMVGYHPRNPIAHGLPSILSTQSKYDTQTGHLSAIVDGTFLTAMRTGAASAIASRALCGVERPVVGLVGCGAQSVSQLHALSRTRDIERVVFFDTDAAAMMSFPERVTRLALAFPLEPAGVEEVVAAADILCVATSVGIGEGPVFHGDGKEHVHVNAVGSDFPGKTELPDKLLEASYVTPDFRAQAEYEGESQRLEPDQIGVDLPELLCSDLPGTLESQRTVFDSTGWALEDLVAMDLVLELANEHGVGKKIDIETTGADPRDPYGFLDRPSASAQAVAELIGAEQ